MPPAMEAFLINLFSVEFITFFLIWFHERFIHMHVTFR